jgi:ABC-type uncharacterized transport system permease subunit
MELFVFIVLTGAAGAYFTSIACRRSQARHRRAGWHLALLGTGLTAFITGAFIGQPELFHPSRWDTGKVSIWYPVVISSSAAAVVALVTSLIVVVMFRVRFRDENHVA